jgi:hypothetical protein
VRLPLTPYAYRTIAELASYCRTLATAIQAGWRQNHDANGHHSSFTWSGTTQTTVGAAGGATALPATPSGYLVIKIDSTSYVVPYYAKS